MEISTVEMITAILTLIAAAIAAYQKLQNISKDEQIARAQNALNTINLQAHQLANGWQTELDGLEESDGKDSCEISKHCVRAENDLRTIAVTAHGLMGVISTDNSAYDKNIDNAINISKKIKDNE